MRKIVHYITIVLLILVGTTTLCQNPNITGYRIEGDDVVFTFNRNDYKTVSPDGFKPSIPFENLTIDNVVVSGQFNNWSMHRWKMKKVDENTYELRKKLSDFTDAFSWEFKFVINHEYWAEPSEQVSNTVQATKDGHHLNVLNLNLYTGAYPAKDGNVRFRLKGYEDAKEVILSGSFNKWNEHTFKMYKIEGGWEIVLQLRPNEYQYRYIVDGFWMEDPSNPDKVLNEFGEYNSHIRVKEYITFTLKGYTDAEKVILAGSFNDWNEEQIEMTKTANGWTITILLPGGKHHYKYIVDGDWIVDPDNPVKEYDSKGYINSVMMVK
ncbi:hypothetical protein [Mangrovimonas sp. TPBH4]|uniref:hypothetical protein n=1 Tax=Mangrovimonas sp. TPBH4 TaxID=1645914 RepID=UPI0006B41D22|nr:hypothetical protein [Mangrovimonas sp. TPBH4]